jgi:DNA-binding transcriptional regulator YiaG
VEACQPPQADRLRPTDRRARGPQYRLSPADTPVQAVPGPLTRVVAAVERGTLPDWRRLARAIRADPRGPVAQQVLEAVRLSRPYGTTELLGGVVKRAREMAADSERAEVATEVRNLVSASGLSRQDLAARLGTSRSRLSTYMSGKVVPSAALVVRMRRVAGARDLSQDVG